MEGKEQPKYKMVLQSDCSSVPCRVAISNALVVAPLLGCCIDEVRYRTLDGTILDTKVF